MLQEKLSRFKRKSQEEVAIAYVRLDKNFMLHVDNVKRFERHLFTKIKMIMYNEISGRLNMA